MTNHPLRGERLEYLVTGIGGSDYYVRMKESIGNWLGLKPSYPRYGTFNTTDKNSVTGPKGVQLGNAGAKYTKLAGFRFVSYKFFLIPNTVIVEPGKNGDQNHTMQTISIGFPRLKENYQKFNESLNKEVSFKEGLKFVFTFEGGLSDDEGDTGGLTNLGITHTEYDQYRASIGLSRRSVADITLVEATDIYRNKYWLLSGCGHTPRRIAISCFDWQVNSGRGVTTLQQTLGNIAVDGLIGPETMNELSSWLSKPTGENHFLHNYFDKREDAYRRWGVGSQAKFLHGWLRRAESLKQYLKVP